MDWDIGMGLEFGIGIGIGIGVDIALTLALTFAFHGIGFCTLSIVGETRKVLRED